MNQKPQVFEDPDREQNQTAGSGGQAGMAPPDAASAVNTDPDRTIIGSDTLQQGPQAVSPALPRAGAAAGMPPVANRRLSASGQGPERDRTVAPGTPTLAGPSGLQAAGEPTPAQLTRPVSKGTETATNQQAATEVTFVKGAGDPGATVMPLDGSPKDAEDFFPTLIEDTAGGTKAANDSSGLVIGDYQVMNELGRGGMGVVYKARHRKLNRVVALKMILAGKHSGSEALKRFIAEARAVAHLQHPGIVQIFEIGEHQGLPWFSLEFVEGKDLQKDLSGQPRDGKRAAALVEQLCLAMQYAHDNSILHRDLKPANVLLDGQGHPKITDFGLAKNVDAEGSGATSDGTIMGSPSYMPPEQARGEMSSISPRSDQYSLGAILYQMLTGRPPFLTDRPLDTVMQVVNSEPVQPRELQPGIPVDLETICMKALQKDAHARYASCAELAADLRRFINGEPILARPISRLERAWRWCRRHPTVAIPSTVAGVFVIATALISTWAWFATSTQAAIIADERDNVKEQRDEAQKQRDEAKRQETIANQQKALAEENQEKAERQAALALENIQFVVTDIDQRLANQPGTSDLRIAILEAVSKKWDELDVEMAGGIRGEAIPTLMALRQKIASALISLDKLEPAKAELEKNYRMSDERIALKGRNDATRTNKARIAVLLSEVRQRLDGDPADSIHLLEEAVALVREIQKNPQPQEGSPSENDILELLAVAQQNLGVAHLKQGRLPETAAAFEEALKANANVLENIRSAPGFAEKTDNEKDTATAAKQISHDKSALGLAYVQLRLGETERSITNYEKAIAGRREIFSRRPTMLPLKSELAGHLGNYGNALVWLDQIDKAESLLQESLKLSEEVWQADPEKADYKRAVAVAAYRLATARDAQGQADEALSLFERSRVLREELYGASSDEKNKTMLMLSEARVGNVDAARKLSDELGATDKQNGELHLERARALSQLTRHATGEQQAALRDAALTALERAAAEGYSDPFRIGAEPDLDPLHDQDRFKLLVAGLEAARTDKAAQ